MICIHLSQISQNLKLVCILCLLLVWLHEFKATNMTCLPETLFTSFIFLVASSQISGSSVLQGSYRQLFAFSPQKSFISARLFCDCNDHVEKFIFHNTSSKPTCANFLSRKENRRLTFLFLIVIYHCNRLSRSPVSQTIH